MIHLIVSIIIISGTAFSIKKRLTRLENYATCCFASILELIVDLYLDGKYDLYGYFNHGIDWLSLLPIFGLYPALSLVFLNLYPLEGHILKKALYIAGWSLFAIVYEWSAVKAGWFYYNGWKLWYSALWYPCLYLVLILNYKLVRSLQAR